MAARAQFSFQPEVSFIIPLYNGLSATRAGVTSLVRSLPDSLKWEVVLVDDGSTDGTREWLRALPDARFRFHLMPLNGGYAKANNVGARLARGEILFFINNDLRYRCGWFEPMWRLARRQDTGLVGNLQRNLTTGEMDHAGIRIDAKGKTVHRFRPPWWSWPFSSYRVLGATGACCAIRRSLFLNCGGFDESFRNGSEDVDLCFRLQAAGLSIRIARHSLVWHLVSAARGRSLQNEFNYRNLLRKWPDRIAWQAALSWQKAYLWKDFLRQPYGSRPADLLSVLASLIWPTRANLRLGLQHYQHQLAREEGRWARIFGLPSLFTNLTMTSTTHAHFLRGFHYRKFELSPHCSGSAWIREEAEIVLPSKIQVLSFTVEGHVLPPSAQLPTSRGSPGLHLSLHEVAVRAWPMLDQGPFSCSLPCPYGEHGAGTTLKIRLMGTARANALAYLGRKTARWPWPRAFWLRLQEYRQQALNQRLRIDRILINGKVLLDFARASSPLETEFFESYTTVGMNLVGWFDAVLGVGESVRCAARAARAASLPTALIPLKLNCLSPREDHTFSRELQEENPYPVNVFHLDAAQAADIDHHHGPEFRRNRHNIAYWAWELPEFPDSWCRYFQYFQEIWVPSDFVNRAISLKSPVPVVTMPHAISLELPTGNFRQAFGLPEDRFLFLFMYDLNSYSPRKNPGAVLEAYRHAFAGETEKVGLVIKTHSRKGNEKAYSALEESMQDLPSCHLIDRALSRAEANQLMYSCDSFVSLHRSEGFGLAVAEAMYFGKPVISTNWSATSEFVDVDNGWPVAYRLLELETTVGPYARGQIWAEPDPEDAVRCLREVFSEEEERARRGANAARIIRERFSPEVIGKRYRDRIRSIMTW